MKTDRQIEEEIAKITRLQQAAANNALLPGYGKEEREDARAEFLHLSGQIQGLKNALGCNAGEDA